MFQPDFKSAIGKFAAAVQGLELGLPGVLQGQQATIIEREGRIAGFIDSKLSASEQDGKKIYRFCSKDANGAGETQRLIGDYRDFFFARRDLERSKAFSQDLPRLFFLAVGSAYDAFLATALQSSLYMRPELLPQLEVCAGKAIEEEAASPEELRERLVESEVNRLAGGDYADYSTWLAKKMSISPADLEMPTKFTEAMARRRLHLYNNGAVSESYLELCHRHGFSADGLSIGGQAEITQEYFAGACGAIYETGVKLGHLLWRAAAPQEISKANAALQDLTFGLIQERRYAMARKLLAFANEKLSNYNDANNRLVFLLNGALASYLANEKDECRRMLGSEDWSAQMDILQLANLVLTEQFEQAAALMRKLGKDNRPSKNEYLRWPLFEQFRKRPEFIAAFSEIFDEITLTESEVRPFERATAK